MRRPPRKPDSIGAGRLRGRAASRSNRLQLISMNSRHLLLLATLLTLVSCSSSTRTTSVVAARDTSSASEFQLDRLTFAVINVEGMVAFYQSVFNMRFKKVDGPGAYLYEGKLFGINYLLVPNDIAGVRAEQSRYQVEVKVRDVDAVVQRAVMV